MATEHLWTQLTERERTDLARVLGATPETDFDGRGEAERATLRSVHLGMTRALSCVDLWGEVTGLLWVSPNQVGLVVRDAEAFFELARDARRDDGSHVFRADPRWLLRYFKHGAEWSLRQAGEGEWGLQLYRRGEHRQTDGEIVADLDRAALAGGFVAHVLDVLRPKVSDPLAGWNTLALRANGPPSADREPEDVGPADA